MFRESAGRFVVLRLAATNFRIHAALLLGSTLWCLAIFAAALLHSAALYLFFSRICHQLPDRSWHIHGAQLALCIRCTAISFGFLAGLLVLRRPRTRWFTLSVAITIAEWLLAFVLFDSEILRAATGILVGATAAPIVRKGVEEMLTRRVRTAYGSM